MRFIFALLLCLTLPAPSAAWGFEAHKVIADRFIDVLPPALRPLFEARRAFITEHSVDPDLWRTAGFEMEPPNHFLDIDHAAFGPYPFEGLPRAYDAAVQKFGREFLQQQGLLPWRVPEFYGHLERAFASLKRPSPPPYTLDNIVYYAAVLSHYVSDGHVPLHAVVNYDGQLTGQHGLHARWESELFERNRSVLTVKPAAPTAVADPRTFMFDVLLASNRMAADVLAADRAAVEGRDAYDDGYFAAFGARALPGLEQRLNESITAVAGVVVGAWKRRGGRTCQPACRELRVACAVLNSVNVYFIPLASGRFEPYYEQEAPDDAGPVAGAPAGFFARMAARFSQMIRDAEDHRHDQALHQPPATAMGRLQRTLMGWVAERVAEQRLLWQLRRADQATLHVPEGLDETAALRMLRRGLQKDADRHLRLLGLHALGLLASVPFVVIPGPNVFGYFFTFTVVGHFLAYRGARRGGSTVTWDVMPNPALTTLGHAATVPPPECFRLIQEAAEQLRLPRVARFVERMAARPA